MLHQYMHADVFNCYVHHPLYFNLINMEIFCSIFRDNLPAGFDKVMRISINKDVRRGRLTYCSP